MHSFTRHPPPSGEAATTPTKGLILSGGWRYDLHGWFLDAFLFRGKGRELRQKTITLAHLQPGEQVLDVGCGTGTLALEVAHRVGRSGRVVGIDPGEVQIERARTKAARRHLTIEFEAGVIEQLAFPDQTFDVVLSTLMLHHLPAPLKRQGLVEIARVLKGGGRLIIADFTRKQDRAGLAARFHAGGSSLQHVVSLLEEAGFSQMETEELPPPRLSAFPGASLIRAYKLADEGAITEREG
jgi:ubiquinone/menaquinone biosynthesis C-methylase UbiE